MFNYNKTDLERIASSTYFIRDNLEKVFRLNEILKHLNENPFFEKFLVLKGGTAINLTILDLPRLSVDIDLDFTIECTKEEMLKTRENVNQNLLNYMFTQGYALSPNTKNPHSLDSWIFYFQNSGGNRDNLKVEINYSMRNHLLPLIKRRVKIDFMQSDYDVKTLSTLELFGGKIKALIERTAPRDLYDVFNMLKYNIIDPKEYELLRKIVIFYICVGGSDSLITSYDIHRINKIKFPQIRSTLLPVLKKNEKFDFENAKTEVTCFLSKLLMITEKEMAFIENFTNNTYLPDLLFEDIDIVNRVKNHPMAIWKTSKMG
ncbi:MAG: nucleotidyl transferase AbiEii/AbiGii toxin family protein [Bacteroidales bacterium]